MVENLDLLVAAVVYVHIFLLRGWREANPPRSPPIIWKAFLSLDPNIVFEVSHLIENLDPVALPVTDIDQAVVADGNTMHNLHEGATRTRIGLFFCPLMPPLTQEFSGSVENSYAAITVTVRDVDIAVCGIYRYVGWHVELRVTRIQRTALESAVRSIDNSSFADLHKQFPVVTVFLNDSIAIAGGPKIVLVVDDAAVGDVRNSVPVAEAIHHITVGIEFDVRWGLPRNFRFLVRHIVPIDDENVILRVHTYTAHLSNYPIFRQQPRPVGIDDEFRATALRLYATANSQGSQQSQANPKLVEEPQFHFHFASHGKTELALKYAGSPVNRQTAQASRISIHTFVLPISVWLAPHPSSPVKN